VTPWLDPAELRIGLGCMRLSTEEDRDEERAIATIRAARDAGITVFDTARAYGDNERLIASALAGCAGGVRVVTKGGMARPGGGWVPDGRAKAIRADCEASLGALDGLGIDLYLLHAPDPRTPWRTSVLALARLVEDGLVARVGLSNVTAGQLEEACAVAPVSAVEVALSAFDDDAARGGVLARCREEGIALIAHSPLGGPRRSPRVARNEALVEVARARAATPAEVALAWVLGLGDNVVAIPGARRPETAESAARAARLALSDGDRARLATAFGGTAPPGARTRSGSEIVLVMGIPGAGKSRIAHQYVSRGLLRLNRDELGGSLRDLADRLDEALADGTGGVLLDSTYLTRVARSYVIETAARHGAAVRCVWLDTPLDQAQINLVERLLERFGELPTPNRIRAAARHEAGLMMPTSQMRTVRELEPPSAEEGFVAVERVLFTRAALPGRAGSGVLVAARVLECDGWCKALAATDPTAPHLVYDWRPGGSDDDLRSTASAIERVVEGPVEIGVCPHGAGPPTCWCRPPLPGLALAFARRHAIDLARLSVVGAAPAVRTLARALGARYVEVPRLPGSTTGPRR
jgi:aryl-alcohol dehydrogenase-like predicted oxidoreductase